MRYLIFNPPGISRRARPLLDALHKSAKEFGFDAFQNAVYGPCDILVMYGMGGARQFPVAIRHLAQGKTLITFDVGYWDRNYRHRKWRVSINGFHCHDYIFLGERPSPDRFIESGLKVYPDKIQDGPILLVGNGPKSNAVGADGWAAKKSKEIKKLFPGLKITYKPKPKRPIEPGVKFDFVTHEPIDDALKKVSLVVTRHSNVAVDACRLGVPVVCEDGAAASIYPARLSDYKNQPDLTMRLEFMHRIAWWQWSTREIRDGKFWPWMADRLDNVALHERKRNNEDQLCMR